MAPLASTTPNWVSCGARTYGARPYAAGSASIQHQAKKPAAPRPRLDHARSRSWAAIRWGSNWADEAPYSWTITGRPVPAASATSKAAAWVVRGLSRPSGKTPGW